MEKMIVMQININNEGWHTVLLTKNTQPLDYMINEVLNYDEFTQIRIGIIFEDRLVPIDEFDNKKEIKVQDIHKKIAKN